jgi:hypothetical protein
VQASFTVGGEWIPDENQGGEAQPETSPEPDSDYEDEVNPEPVADSEDSAKVEEEVAEVTTQIPTRSEYYLDDVIISGIEKSLGIEVPFDMKLRYKEAGEPSPMASQKTGPKMVRLKNFFYNFRGFYNYVSH